MVPSLVDGTSSKSFTHYMTFVTPTKRKRRCTVINVHSIPCSLQVPRAATPARLQKSHVCKLRPRQHTCLPTKTIASSALARLFICSVGNMIAKHPGLNCLPLYSNRTPSKTRILMSRRRAGVGVVNCNRPDLELPNNRDISLFSRTTSIRDLTKPSRMICRRTNPHRNTVGLREEMPLQIGTYAQ